MATIIRCRLCGETFTPHEFDEEEALTHVMRHHFPLIEAIVRGVFETRETGVEQ